MKSPLKPLSKSLKVLGFLIGNAINIKKFNESEGIVFEKNRFLILKILLLFAPQSVASVLLFGYIFIHNIK